MSAKQKKLLSACVLTGEDNIKAMKELERKKQEVLESKELCRRERGQKETKNC